MSLAQEIPEQNEEQDARLIAERFTRELHRYYGKGSYKRMFHPKTHGLLAAQFEIPTDLPPQYAAGLFQPGASYPAWVRFSNAKRHPSEDYKKDMRGMAIKLFNVPGTQLMPDNQAAGTQDFLLVTSKTLQTKSVKDFRKSIYALTDGGIKLFFFAITHLPIIFRSLGQISKCSNLLEESYFSTTPYLYGNGNAVKYGVFPQRKRSSAEPNKKEAFYLRKRLVEDVKSSDATFDFMVQFQTDAKKQPIEDPTKEWKSAFVKVATIRIPQQEFDSQEQLQYGENLSFTPWHCVEEHRPLGGVNRARKTVYEAIATLRRTLNKAPETEPSERKTF